EPLVQKPSHRLDGTMPVGMVGRMRSGVEMTQVRAEMDVLNRWRVEELVRAKNAPFLRQFTLEVDSAASGLPMLRDHFGAPLVAALAGVAVLLLIACTNVASMLIARAAGRQREMAVRVAVGASRLRVMRQVLTESIILSAASGLVGVVFAYE